MTATTLDKEELRQIVADTLDVDLDDVTDSAHFVETLGVDSLMALEVMVVLEKRYRVKIEEARLRDIVCLAAAHELIAELLGAAA